MRCLFLQLIEPVEAVLESGVEGLVKLEEGHIPVMAGHIGLQGFALLEQGAAGGRDVRKDAGADTGMPNISAIICRQKGLLAPPPQASMLSGATCMPRSTFRFCHWE